MYLYPLNTHPHLIITCIPTTLGQQRTHVFNQWSLSCHSRTQLVEWTHPINYAYMQHISVPRPTVIEHHLRFGWHCNMSLAWAFVCLYIHRRLRDPDDRRVFVGSCRVRVCVCILRITCNTIYQIYELYLQNGDQQRVPIRISNSP